MADIFSWHNVYELSNHLNPFGYAVVVAFALGCLVLAKEVSRKQKQGIFPKERFTLLMRREANRYSFGLSGLDIASITCITVVLSGLFGAKLGYILLNLQLYDEQPLAILLYPSGFLFPTALLAAIIATTLCLWRMRLPALVCFDAAAPASLIGYAVAKLGALIGEYANNKTAFEAMALSGGEAMAAFLGFLTLWAYRDHQRQQGFLASIAVVWLMTLHVGFKHFTDDANTHETIAAAARDNVLTIAFLCLATLVVYQRSQSRDSRDHPPC